MAALLQAETGSDKPVLLRVEREAGHGAGKPLAKLVEETADAVAFFTGQLCPPPRHRQDRVTVSAPRHA
jgi:prolyl oligopeptidase